MLRTLLAGLAALSLCLSTAASAAAPAGSEPDQLPIHDLTGDYTRFYHASIGQPPANRAAAFRKLMAEKFPGFFTETRHGATAAQYDALVIKALEAFPKIETRFTARAAALGPALAAAIGDFRRTFPDAGPLPPTYLVHSLGEMDGGTREIGGKTVLVFGADMIAQLHREDANERPFFEHELFHTYHEPRFGDCKPIWCALWEEGLATFVADKLNPGAKDDELLLPMAMRRQIDAKLAEAACAVLQRAMSEKPGDYSALFNSDRNLPGLPQRAGYYVGYLVAKSLAEGRSLPELAQWDQAAARPRILAELAKMAPNCPAAAP
ncbi:MAG: hypothetical protein WCL10_06775 [Novosphingobium sp.]|uniref:hypothetical protein n=1 Tax=Novosphingobium sp. TaxID=1874826 RepID=UPI0030197C33